MPESADVASARGRYRVMIRHRGPDDPNTIAARRDLAVEKITDGIRRLVDSGPRFTTEEIDRLHGVITESTKDDRT